MSHQASLHDLSFSLSFNQGLRALFRYGVNGKFFVFQKKTCHEDGRTTITVKTLNIGTPRPATVVILKIKQFNFTMK